MLEFFRSNSQSFVFKALLGLIVLSFVAWGAGDFVRSNAQTTAIEVDSVKVSAYDLARDYQNALARQQKQLAVLPEQFQEMIKTQVQQQMLKQNLDRALILSTANDLNLVADDISLYRYIKGIPQFADEQGNFDPEVYKSVLLNAGYTPESYEQGLSEDIIRSQVMTSIANLAIQDKDSFERGLKVAYQTRDLNVLYLTKKHLKNKATATTEQLKGAYEATKAQYMTTEKRSGLMLNLSLERVAQNTKVSKEEARSEYDADPSSFMTAERRQISRILVEDEMQATKVLDLLNKGDDFAEVAKKFSTDTLTNEKGGNMGLIAKGELSPSFDKVAFALDKGEVSNKIETPFGINIVKVIDIAPARLQKFDEVYAAIAKELKTEKAEDAYQVIVETLEDKLAAGESLEKAAKEAGLTMTTVSNVAADSTKFPAAAIENLFTLTEGETSDLIAVNDTTEAYIHLTKVNASEQKSFATVKADVKKAFLAQQTQEALSALASTMIKQVKAGNSLKTVMRQQRLKTGLQTYLDVTRKAGSDKVPENIRTTAFSIIGKTVANNAIPSDKGLAIIEVTDTSVQDINKDMRAAYQAQVNNQFANDLYVEFMASVRANANVQIRDSLVKQAFGVAQ